jgi:MSHA biogenesis protein MshL
MSKAMTGKGALLLLTALGGCGGPMLKTGDAFDRMREDVAREASARKSSDDAATKALMPPLQVEAPKAAEQEQRFDLAVVNAPANQVFMALVSGTRYNMLLPSDLSGSITVNLKDVTLKEALETLRDLYGYEYKVQGNRIMVSPNTMQTRIFQINYLASERRGSSDLRVSSSSMTNTGQNQGGGTSAPATPAGGTPGTGQQTAVAVDTARVSMSSDVNFWRDLTAALTTIVGHENGRQVIVNPMSGVVLVKAMPGEMHNVEKYLKATQVVVERQVMLEAKIIEVSLSQEYQSGINWAHFNSAGGHNWSRNGNTGQFSVPGGTPLSTIDANGHIFPSTVTGTAGVLSAISNVSSAGGVLGLAFQTASFAALINFLESQGSVTVLSSPRIATINNQKAVLKVGTDELFITNISTTTTTSTSGTVSTPTLTLQPYFSGISLDVTPQIDEDGLIILHVHPAVSVVKEKAKNIDLGATLGTFKLPLASSTINETDSVVRVKDGNIVAIGGLMRDEQRGDGSGLPGVGDIPVVGAFFSDHSKYHKKSELVILIKPTVIQSSRNWQDDLEQLQGRLKNYDPRLIEPMQEQRPQQ